MPDAITTILAGIVLLLTLLLIACLVYAGKRERSLRKQVVSLSENLEQQVGEKISRKSAIYDGVCRIHLYSQIAEEEADTRSMREKQQVMQEECEKILEVLSQPTEEF